MRRNGRIGMWTGGWIGAAAGLTAGLTVALVAAIAATASGQAPAAGRTVLDGVYSDAQALRGEAIYDRSCGGCHGPDLDGGGQARPLRAESFLDAWREDSLTAFFVYASTRMPFPPAGQPGSLSEQEYLDIVAYVLARNEFPAGPRELTRADLSAVMLVGPDGPAPLPANASVRAVGCLARNAAGWRLERAAAPARVRDTSSVDPSELEASAGVAPGDHAFRLANMEEQKEADLAGRIGSRVQVKGVLNGTGDAARIYVLSLQPVTGTCTP